MTLKPYAPLDNWWEANKHNEEKRTGASSCLAYFDKYIGNLCTNCQMELTSRDYKFGPPEICESCFDLEMAEEERILDLFFSRQEDIPNPTLDKSDDDRL